MLQAEDTTCMKPLRFEQMMFAEIEIKDVKKGRIGRALCATSRNSNLFLEALKRTSLICTSELSLVAIWKIILKGGSLKAGGSAFSKQAIRIQEIIRVLELKK